MSDPPPITRSNPAHRQAVVKAVIPAAGMGTRFLPATKSMPKEMLPIVDKPVLQFVIEEAVASGITDILIITGRGKRAIEDHFDANPELETFLKTAGKNDLLEHAHHLAPGCRIYYIRQNRPRGLGDAIRLARDHVGDAPFTVLLGDTVIDPAPSSPPGLRQLIDAHERIGAGVVAVHRVPADWVGRYGIVDGEAESADNPDLLKLRGLVEKPSAADAPSDLAIAGRYILTPDIFDCIDEVDSDADSELQLTDALNLLARRRPFYALRWDARRYDIGNRIDYARCFIDFALRRPDTADAVRDHLNQLHPANRNPGR
jgi:UTP--glucose-1-phosphate uridylyltransferase